MENVRINFKDILKNRIDLGIIDRYYNELNGYKQNYIPLFQKIAKYCDYGADIFNLGTMEGKNDFQPYRDSKIGGENVKIQDVTIINAINIAINQFYGLLVGNGQFFKLISVDDNENSEFFDGVKNGVIEHLNKANFETFLFDILNELIIYGNSCYSLKYNRDYNGLNSIYNLEQFNISSFCFDAGKNRDVENVYIDMLLTNQEILETFRSLPPEFVEMARNKPVEKTKIRYACMRNRFYSSNNFNDFRRNEWLGVYYFSEKYRDTIIDIEFYSKKPVNIARDTRVNSEIWGRSSTAKIINVVELLNKINIMSVDAIAKMITTTYGQYAGAKTDGKPLDLWTGKSVNNFNFINGLAGASPIFAIPKNIQDPRAMVEYLRDDLVKQIYNAFFIDSLMDMALTTSKATAT
jgi:hypothetical protein